MDLNISWQDIVIAVSNLLFVVSLTNQVIHGFKHKKTSITLATSSLTSLGLILMCVAFFTLKMYLSSAISFLSTILWILLALQKIIYK